MLIGQSFRLEAVFLGEGVAAEIAAEVGCATVQGFSAAFRARTASSPGGYRGGQV